MTIPACERLVRVALRCDGWTSHVTTGVLCFLNHSFPALFPILPTIFGYIMYASFVCLLFSWHIAYGFSLVQDMKIW
jgi:hypothetical protein